jgi:signal transduction histidine kinase
MGVTAGSHPLEERRSPAELERVAEEQAALRRVATLVARGATERELAEAVSRELGHLFGADAANTLRWEGETIRVIGDWYAEGETAAGRVMPFGGDTITARVVQSAAPARLNSAGDLQTEFAKRRWAELGLQASIGAPIWVDGRIWGVVTASRTERGNPFPPNAEDQLGDFTALIAQSIVNAEARRETAELVAEQSALRRIATLVAAGRPQGEVLDAVNSEVASIFGATKVTLVRWLGVQDEVVVVASWSDGSTWPLEPGSLYHPGHESAMITVLETGFASRSEDPSREHVIAAPVIIKASLLGALAASRLGTDPFPPGAEIRLRSFADLAAQSIANEQAQAELRASRARIVRTADETRERFERNLHDGAQQRLVSVSGVLRLATAKLPAAPDDARALVVSASEELTQALEELRDLARGLHPAVLTKHGLEPALEALASRAPLPVTVVNELGGRLPPAVEAAVYYVVAESLTNVAKYASASRVNVLATCTDGLVRVEVADDGVGGADVGRGSGLRGLADRIEALGGRFGIESAPGEGTRVWAAVNRTSAQASE